MTLTDKQAKTRLISRTAAFVLLLYAFAPGFAPLLTAATPSKVLRVQGPTAGTGDPLPASQSGTWTVQPGNTANTTAWKVDGSAVTQPVSGTFWQATQPISGTVTANQGGTWTVQPGNTANTTAWKVDGSAVTQPVSGTLSVSGQTTGTLADAFTTPGAIQQKQGFNEVYNGATWDMQRSANGASATTGTGLAGSGLLGWDTTNWQKVRSDTSGRLFMQGAVAVSAAGNATNPVLVGVLDGSNTAQHLRMRADAGDGQTAGAPTLLVSADPYLYNGTSFDRGRNNNSVSILASAARTTTQTVALTTWNARTLTLIVNVTVIGTGSITPSVQLVDSVSGSTFTVWTATAALTGNGMAVYRFEAGNTGATGGLFTEKITSGIPGRTLNIVITANNANSCTYSCSAELQ